MSGKSSQMNRGKATRRRPQKKAGTPIDSIELEFISPRSLRSKGKKKTCKVEPKRPEPELQEPLEIPIAVTSDPLTTLIDDESKNELGGKSSLTKGNSRPPTRAVSPIKLEFVSPRSSRPPTKAVSPIKLEFVSPRSLRSKGKKKPTSKAESKQLNVDEPLEILRIATSDDLLTALIDNKSKEGPGGKSSPMKGKRRRGRPKGSTIATHSATKIATKKLKVECEQTPSVPSSANDQQPALTAVAERKSIFEIFDELMPPRLPHVDDTASVDNTSDYASTSTEVPPGFSCTTDTSDHNYVAPSRKAGRKKTAALSRSLQPSITTFMKSMQGVSVKIHFERGAVVWVRYQRFPVWPAIVVGFDKSKKKYTFVYLPVHLPIVMKNITTFRQSCNKIWPFETEYTKMYDTGDKMELFKAVRQADALVRHRVRYDPFTDDASALEIFNVDDEPPETLTCTDEEEKASIVPTASRVTPAELSFSASDDESIFDLQLAERRTPTDTELNALMTLIQSRQCHIYLTQLANKELPLCEETRERWDLMLRLTKMGGGVWQRQLIPSLGILSCRVDQLTEVTSEVKTPYDDDERSDRLAAFHTYVLNPEAVKWALMTLHGATAEEAEMWLSDDERYYRGVEDKERAATESPPLLSASVTMLSHSDSNVSSGIDLLLAVTEDDRNRICHHIDDVIEH